MFWLSTEFCISKYPPISFLTNKWESHWVNVQAMRQKKKIDKTVHVHAFIVSKTKWNAINLASPQETNKYIGWNILSQTKGLDFGISLVFLLRQARAPKHIAYQLKTYLKISYEWHAESWLSGSLSGSQGNLALPPGLRVSLPRTWLTDAHPVATNTRNVGPQDSLLIITAIMSKTWMVLATPSAT